MSGKSIRIGQILIKQGVLSEQQVLEILQVQKKQRLPFGVIAERFFDTTVGSIEEAWVEQYHRFTGTIDLTQQRFDDQALRLINRRQAWQFQMLPINIEPSGELLVAASRQRLARAVTFAAGRVEPVVYFRIAESSQLQQFLQEYYPMPQVCDQMIERARRSMGSS